MTTIRWGIVGCGDVTEVKSGPALQKADGSALVAVMRRDLAKAQDYAHRHGVPRAYGSVDALLSDPEVDAVYVATPPSSHASIALRVAEAGKPCLVEKPMATRHGECEQMIGAFAERRLPLFVAYYRRAMPRFLLVRDLLRSGVVGRLTSAHVLQYGRLATGGEARTWRFDPAIAGAGLFLDLASHGLDLIDFLAGRIVRAEGVALNTGGTYVAEDVTTICFECEGGVAGTGVWNFNADRSEDGLVLTGSDGEIGTPVFSDGDVVVRRGGREERHPVERPQHVHQPLVQSIVDELRGRGRCESTGTSAARTSWVMERCLARYYASPATAPTPVAPTD